MCTIRQKELLLVPLTENIGLKKCSFNKTFRTMAGLTAARARGKQGGRPKTAADDTRVLMAKKMSQNKGISIGEICSTLKISRATYS